MRLLLAALLMMCVAPVMAQDTPAHAAPDEAVIQAIRPAMTNFRREAAGLEQAMNVLCQTPSAEALATASDRFGKAVLAYGHVELIRIGPLMEDNRSERLLFWPDRRGIGLRQVQAILADKDETAATAEGLAGKSVAVQGLGALEFVLFGTGAEELATADGDFRCRYGRAIAQSVSAIAEQLQAGWYSPKGVAVRLMAPRPEYPDYRTDIEALEALVGVLSHGVEAVRDIRLNPVLSVDGAPAKPKQGLFWRSGLTIPMIRADIEGLETLYRLSGVGTAAPGSSIGIGNSIAFEFKNAFRALDLVTLPLEQALEDEKQAHALDYLVLVTQSLQTMIGEQLSSQLELSVGFSSLDGD